MRSATENKSPQCNSDLGPCTRVRLIKLNANKFTQRRRRERDSICLDLSSNGRKLKNVHPTCYKFQIRAYFSYRLNDTLKREITSTANMLFYVNTLLSFSLFPIQTHICLSQATANHKLPCEQQICCSGSGRCCSSDCCAHRSG